MALTLLLGDSTSDILRKIESDIFYPYRREHLPCISGEPIFDDSNVQRLLGCVKHPSVTKKLVESLLGYAVMTDFGRNENVSLKSEMV